MATWMYFSNRTVNLTNQTKSNPVHYFQAMSRSWDHKVIIYYRRTTRSPAAGAVHLSPQQPQHHFNTAEQYLNTFFDIIYSDFPPIPFTRGRFIVKNVISSTRSWNETSVKTDRQYDWRTCRLGRHVDWHTGRLLKNQPKWKRVTLNQDLLCQS